jgi:hypothetical protein
MTELAPPVHLMLRLPTPLLLANVEKMSYAPKLTDETDLNEQEGAAQAGVSTKNQAIWLMYHSRFLQ